MRIWAPFFAIFTITTVAATAQERPDALREFERARKSIASGRFEWSVLRDGDPDQAMSYVSRYAANGDLIFENRGDKDGWTIFDGRTREGASRYPQLYMSNREGFWAYQESTDRCSWWSNKNGENHAKTELRDVRALGTHPAAGILEYSYGLTWLDDPQMRIEEWTQEEVDDLQVVTARMAGGGTFTWYINPERGWNAERIEYDTGYGRWEAVSALANYDGIWFPEETRYYRDNRLVETIVVKSAAFNRPEDPRKFTLNDLGLEPGSAIAAQDLPPVSGRDLRTWNGEEIVPFENWAQDVREGRRVVGPIRKRMFEKGYFESIYDTPEQTEQRKLYVRDMFVKHALTRHVDLWEQYVRDFIARYKLDDEQTQKAWAIFLECRRRGDAIIDHNKNKLTELVSLGLAAKEAGEKEKEAKLDEQIAKLREPVDRIFEESLKPRLDRLPTRAQRKAAEASVNATEQAAPTSSPSP